MNRKKIIEIILQLNEYTDEQKKIIQGIEESIVELESVRNCFQNVTEKNLIDIYIYKEEEAKAKYTYFLEKAKQTGIRINASYMLEELSATSKWQ